MADKRELLLLKKISQYKLEVLNLKIRYGYSPLEGGASSLEGGSKESWDSIISSLRDIDVQPQNKKTIIHNFKKRFNNLSLSEKSEHIDAYNTMLSLYK